MKHVLSRILITSGLLLSCSLFTAAHAAEAGAGVAKPDMAAGQKLYTDGDATRGIVSCASCHGAAGNSSIPANPNLADLPYEYIVKQLHDFKPRPDNQPAIRLGAGGAPSVMTTFAAQLTDQDIQNVAYYLSTQPLAYDTAPTATKEDTAERGQQIWRGGIADRRVPACAGCHSPNGAGIPAEYPRLAGQFPGYIEEQLRLFRSGARGNNLIMHEIADRMSDRDIAAVADYAAGLR